MAISDNLIKDEKIVFESKKHWAAPLRDSIVPALMIVGFLLLRTISPNGGGLFGAVGSLMDFIALGLLVVGIGWIVYNIFTWRTAAFAVTNLRVIREEGLISHRSSATLFTSLSDVKTNVSLGGRQLGFGDVVIYSQSGDAGVDRFRTITTPIQFRDAIMTQKTKAPAPAAAVPTAAVPTAPVAMAQATPAVMAPAAPPVVTQAQSSADAAAALASLADLHDRGAVTDAEFEAKKAEILARM